MTVEQAGSGLWTEHIPGKGDPDFVLGRLREKYGEPPFTVLLGGDMTGAPPHVLQTMSGAWQERRRDWLSLGIQSELGRGEAGIGSNAVPADAIGDFDALRASRGSAARQAAMANPTMPGHVTGEPGSLSARVAGRGSAGDGAARSYRVDLMRGEKSDQYDYAGDGDGGAAPGTSIFDPVLAELVYRWFAPAGGTVLDPFAGGSVRGIVAAALGHPYTGIELSARQVAANRQQADDILTGLVPPHLAATVWPTWRVGDSAEILPGLLHPKPYDLLFTCPPYYDLEVYSSDPADISRAPNVEAFAYGLGSIMSKAAAHLADDRFAVVVMGEARYQTGPRKGHLYGLVPLTIAAMEQAGLAYYNDAILVNSAGSLPVRISAQFEAARSGRKLGRRHQYVLVFVKGDPPTGEWSYKRSYSPPGPQLEAGLLDAPVTGDPRDNAPAPVPGSAPAVGELLPTAGADPPAAAPIYIRCQACGGTLLMLDGLKTCEACGWRP